MTNVRINKNTCQYQMYVELTQIKDNVLFTAEEFGKRPNLIKFKNQFNPYENNLWRFHRFPKKGTGPGPLVWRMEKNNVIYYQRRIPISALTDENYLLFRDHASRFRNNSAGSRQLGKMTSYIEKPEKNKKKNPPMNELVPIYFTSEQFEQLKKKAGKKSIQNHIMTKV
jgi:hypothetical protein